MKINGIFCRKGLLLFVSIILLTIPILPISISSTIVTDSSPNGDFDFEALTPSLPIRIENDTAFNVNYGFPGAGIPGNPYRIEYLNITTSATYGIYVTGVNVQFIIQNCYIDAGDYGIYFSGVSDGRGTIDNNFCVSNTDDGIYIEDSLDMIVTNNTCLYNGNSGIYTNYADYSSFLNNTCKWNFFGIFLHDTYTSFVINNTCSENDYGMLLEWIDGTVVEDNICNDQDYGIVVSGVTSDILITNNICKNITSLGISLHTVFSSNVSLNYLEDIDDIAIELYDCQTIIVTNNTIVDNFRGIYMEITGSSNFTYNLIQDNTQYGVYVSLVSEYNVFHHNAFISNAIGLGSAQAYDVGNFSTWYDVSTNEGNYWEDWGGFDSYAIDGDGEFFVDLYPLSVSPIPKISEFYGHQSLILVLLISVSLPTFLLARKRKKG